jgi:putative flippase GtrA
MSKRAPLTRQFASFAIIGALGFGVDAGVFALLLELHDWPVAPARAISVLCAVTATWLLNRRITFRRSAGRDRLAEYIRYAAGQLGGLTINVGTFALCLATGAEMIRQPIIALTIGSLAALAFNFIVARRLVFRLDV